MNSESEKMQLQSLEEYVLDEGRIVTYRWLSKVLNIHVNLSKELLSKFSSNPIHTSNVYLTYLVSGKLKDGTYGVVVTGQDKFDDTKLDFEQITSHHVYSIQKKKEAPSESLLYMANSEKVENEVDVSKQIGSIKCTASIQRAADEMANLRLQSLSKPESSSSFAQVKKASPPTDSAKKESEKSNAETSTPDKNTDKNSKPKTGPTGIAAMFAAQTSKSSKSSPSSNQTKAKPPAKKAGGINSFFSKVPKTEPQSTTTSPQDTLKTEKQDSEDLSMDVDTPTKETNVKDELEKSVQETKAPSPPPPVPDKVEKEKGKASSSKENNKTSKRKSKTKSKTKKEKLRKRIKVIDSDSSDDDIFGEERESSPEPDSRSTPPPSRKIEDSSDDEIIPPTPQPQPESEKKNHRKRKVVKDRSYVDDDGYIVTEKVTVYQSCSDEETEAKENVKKPKEEPTSNAAKANGTTANVAKTKKPVKKTASPVKKTTSPVKKTTSPVKNKQASLMSFFKRV